MKIWSKQNHDTYKREQDSWSYERSYYQARLVGGAVLATELLDRINLYVRVSSLQAPRSGSNQDTLTRSLNKTVDRMNYYQ